MGIPERVKLLRTAANMTQEELGNLLGVQKAAIQKYESGAVNFKVDTVMRLANIFNVSIEYILGTEKFDKSISLEGLKQEVEMIELVHKHFGDLGVELYRITRSLNKDGIERLILYGEDLLANPKYTK